MSDKTTQALTSITSQPEKNLGQSLNEIFSMVEPDFDFSKYKSTKSERQRFTDKRGAFGEMVDKDIHDQRKKLAE